MALEIEFEDDDHPDVVLPDTGVPASDSAPDARGEAAVAQGMVAEEAAPEETGTTSSRIGALLASPLPLTRGLLLQLGILLTTFVVGASSVAGYQLGRTAPQKRSIVALHLGGGRPYQFGLAPVQRDATWSDTTQRPVSLTVVNDGPDRLAVTGGTVSGPLVHADFALPAGGLDLAAGASATLHAAARVDCRSVFEPFFMADGDPSSLDTVADFGVRTLDGRTHRARLTVDPASATAVSGVCMLLGPPVGVTGIHFSGLIGSDTYTVTYHTTNSAPFRVSVGTLQSSVSQWSFSGGLTARLADPAATLPPLASADVVVDVTVTDCSAALRANDDEFGFFPLVFGEAGGAAKHEEFAQPMPLVSRTAIGQACHGR